MRANFPFEITLSVGSNEPKTGDAQVLAPEAIARHAEPPSLYQVVMLNDDFTPMEFVIHALQVFFHHDVEAATLIMLKIHHDGRGICGVFTKDIASTKVELVLAAARSNGHPLQCTLERT